MNNTSKLLRLNWLVWRFRDISFYILILFIKTTMIKPLGIGLGLLAAAVGGLIIYNRNQESKRVIPEK